MSKKDNLVYKAKLAEQAERYDGLYTICCLFFIFAESCRMGHPWNLTIYCVILVRRPTLCPFKLVSLLVSN